MSTHAGQSAHARLPGAVLCASAMVLVGLIISQLGRVGSPAHAATMLDLVAQGGDYAMLTVDAGSDDVLVVLDQRAEELLVYRTINQSRVELKARQSVRDLFFAARQSQGGAPLPAAPGPASTPSPGGGSPR